MSSESIQTEDREQRARELYSRYGALPWSRLPERTRDHFRCLIRDNIDGAGRPLDPRATAARHDPGAPDR